MSSLLNKILTYVGYPSQTERSAQNDKEMREHLTEHQIDETLKDSFPSSDPPAWY